MSSRFIFFLKIHFFILGDSIPIYAVIENYSSRLIVPKAAIYQIQTFMANGKTKSHTKLVASVRGNHIPSGCTDTWNGKTLKIPPVSASILNSSVIRVEYSLAVSALFYGYFVTLIYYIVKVW